MARESGWISSSHWMDKTLSASRLRFLLTESDFIPLTLVARELYFVGSANANIYINSSRGGYSNGYSNGGGGYGGGGGGYGGGYGGGGGGYGGGGYGGGGYGRDAGAAGGDRMSNLGSGLKKQDWGKLNRYLMCYSACANFICRPRLSP